MVTELSEKKFGKLLQALTLLLRPNHICFTVSKISFIHLITPNDFTNDQNTMRRIIWDHIYTFTNIKRIKDETWNFYIFTIIEETFVKYIG